MRDDARTYCEPLGTAEGTTRPPATADTDVIAEPSDGAMPPAFSAPLPGMVGQSRRPLFENVGKRSVRPRHARTLLATMFAAAILVGLMAGGLGRGFVGGTGSPTSGVDANDTRAVAGIAGENRSDVGAIVDAAKLAPIIPVATVAPTIAPPTIAPIRLTAVQQRIASSEATLHSGQFMTTIDYGNGSSTYSVARFILTDGATPFQLALQSTYKAQTGSQTTERIVNGTSISERPVGAQWRTYKAQHDPREEILSLLPAIGSIPEAAITREGPATLRWHDARRGAAMTLTVDPATWVPLTLRQVFDTTGQVVSISYQGWNTPIAIARP